jgi:D-arabinose 1-dehydrogenase-like Zn-dependent alcohol dehydrogenase
MPSMRRARLVATGWQADLAFEPDAEDPPPPTGRQVLVEVEACGVCHRDLIDRDGRFAFVRLPVTPGHEAAGRVLAVGGEVTRFRPGDRVGTLHRDACGECAACAAGEPSLCAGAAFVLGLLADGGYASRLVAPESALYALPAALPAAQAAIFHCTFGTAWRALSGVSAGQRVLVTGANGGVGVAGVQIAAGLGAEVVAQVRDGRHAALLESLGARQVIVDGGGDIHKQVRGIDVALDCVGQPTFNAALRTLRLGGRLVAVGNVVPERAALNLGYLIVNALDVKGSSGASPRDMEALLAFAGAHALQLPTTEMELARADEAQRRVKAGGVEGRIVLRP